MFLFGTDGAGFLFHLYLATWPERGAQGDRPEPACKAAVLAIDRICAADFALGGLGAKSADILRDSDIDYTRAIAKYFKARFLDKGGAIIGESSDHSGDTDYSGHMTKIGGLNPQPDVVFAAVLPDRQPHAVSHRQGRADTERQAGAVSAPVSCQGVIMIPRRWVCPAPHRDKYKQAPFTKFVKKYQ